MLSSLDISTSGLVAQRTRLAVIAANIANRDTLLDESGGYAPYRRRIVEFGSGDPESGSPLGVHVRAITLDSGPLQPRYEPGSPYADAGGYVDYPNVDPIVEQMNAMEAARGYEANIAAIEATKAMVSVALDLLS